MKRIFAVVLFCVLGLMGLMGQAQTNEWRGWRGETQEGRAAANANPPLNWSPTQNVAWKTALPGEGHSSPIVTADSVYVTAAWAAPSDVRLKTAVQVVLWLLLLGVAAPAFMTILRACRNMANAPPRASDVWQLAGGGVSVFLLCGLVFYGESILDFHRAVERGWIAACLVGVLSLCLSAFAARPGTGFVFLSGLLMLGFALLLGLTIPDREHTIAADPRSDVSILIYLVIALPILAGLWLLAQGIYLHSFSALDGAEVRPPRLRGFVLLFALAVVGVLIKLVRGQQDETDVTISVGEMWLRHLPFWIPLTLAVGIVALMIWGKRRGWSHPLSLGLVVCTTAEILLCLYALLEQAVLRVPYLAYLLGSPTPAPMLGKNAVVGFVACIATIVAWDAWRTRKTHWMETSPPPVFGISARLLSIVYFGYALYVPKEPRMERGIVSVNRETGTIQWQCGGIFAPGETMHSDNSAATPTPVTDGERIHAWFGTPGLMGADKTGKRLWINRKLPYKTREGVASSPLVYRDSVMILSESDAGGFLAAVDGKTGTLRWKTERNKAKHSFAGNCRTPNLVRINGRDVLIVWGYEDLSGYDPQTGRELWTLPVEDVGTGGNPVASAISEGNRLYLAGPYQTLCFDLTKLGSKQNALIWKQDNDEGVQCSSPVVVNDLLFGVSDNGSAYCLDVKTGKELWRHDFEEQHYASVISASDRIYFCGTQGKTTVVECGRKYQQLAQNDLDEPTSASFAPVGDALFVRTRKHLYCLRANPSSP